MDAQRRCLDSESSQPRSQVTNKHGNKTRLVMGTVSVEIKERRMQSTARKLLHLGGQRSLLSEKDF